jgi:glycosyltransferase involved in cell wall biosynthesis
MSEFKGLVSISIPFYNAERFISETIESVLAQTNAQWELLLVDDGSTDRSSEIAHDFVLRWPEKIRYREHPGHRNRGVNASRNLGAKCSQGEYLAFLDSDDIWLPDKLERQVASMDAHPEAGIVFGPTKYWYSWDPDRSDRQEDRVPPLAPGGRLYFPPTLLARSYPLGEYGAPCPSSFLLRRSAFEHIGGFDERFNPETYQLYEDIAFLTKVYLNLPVFVSELCLDNNRCSQFSMTHGLAGSSHEESARRYYFNWLQQYLRSRSVADPEIWKAVRRQAWFYRIPLPAMITKLLRRIDGKLSRVRSRSIEVT